MSAEHEARIAHLEAALQSIAKNTCCSNCREAALVARSALGAYIGLARSGGDAQEARRPVWLRREGDKVVVLVERNKEWFEVIREHHDGEFSHIWEDRTPGKPDEITAPYTTGGK